MFLRDMPPRDVLLSSTLVSLDGSLGMDYVAIVFSNSFMKLPVPGGCLLAVVVDIGDLPGMPFFFIWDTLIWFGIDLS